MGTLLVSCSDPGCAAEFPVAAELAWRRCCCPACSAEGAAISAQVKRALRAERPLRDIPPLPESAVVVVLEDLRSVHNVGSILRTCDAFAVNLVIMTGVTATPEHPKINRTALGAELTVPWAWRADAVDAVNELTTHGLEIVALEHSARAVELGVKAVPPPFALVVGNEVAGISSPVLQRAPRHVFIPMLGSKTSLNAAVACAVGLWQLRR